MDTGDWYSSGHENGTTLKISVFFMQQLWINYFILSYSEKKRRRYLHFLGNDDIIGSLYTGLYFLKKLHVP